MPVQGGYGAADLDFICARKRAFVGGEFLWELFRIEAKAHGQDPSPRQWVMIGQHRAAGRKVFIIDDERDSLQPKHNSLKDLDTWLRG